MAFADLLQHRVNIYGQTNSQDASGGTVITWSVLRASQVPCMIRGLTGSEQALFAQRNIVVTHSIYLLDGSAQTGDKVIDAKTGQNFMLVSIQIQQGVGNIPTFYFWTGRELLPGE